jgi:RNA polymerase primary sigma factor
VRQIDVMAQRTRRAAGHLYVFALPLSQVPDAIPVPSVGIRSEGNRMLSLRHARGFATYWTNTPHWAAPPLLLDTARDLDEWFTVHFTHDGLEAGLLRLPNPATSGLQILDGQHRVYGWYDVRQSLQARAVELRERFDRACDRGEPTDLVVDEAERVAVLADRLMNDHVTVEVLDRTAVEEHKQWFFDIASNAKGITKSLTASFDQRGAINKAALRLADEYEPLSGLVERESDRVGVTSDALLTVAQLLSLVEAAVLGLDGWVRREYADALSVDAVMDVASTAFDVLFDGFDDLRDVAERTIEPAALRRTSLLGSVTFLRVLVGLVHELSVSIDDGAYSLDSVAIDETVDFYQSISSAMTGPIPDRLWESGSFTTRDSRSPKARRQEIKAVRNTLLEMANSYRESRAVPMVQEAVAALPARVRSSSPKVGPPTTHLSAMRYPTSLFDLPQETR